jgi:hypothetical protein
MVVEPPSSLAKEYEEETGGQAYMEEPGRIGIWASCGYIAWLEGNFEERSELKEQSLKKAIENALVTLQEKPTWERIKHEPLMFLSFSDLATDLAPLLKNEIEQVDGERAT